MSELIVCVECNHHGDASEFIESSSGQGLCSVACRESLTGMTEQEMQEIVASLDSEEEARLQEMAADQCYWKTSFNPPDDMPF